MILAIPFLGNAQLVRFKAVGLSESMHHKPDLVLGIDSRNAFISNRQARMLGARAGVSFNDFLRFGISGYGMTGNVSQRFLFSENEIEDLKVRFWYLAAFTEMVWLKNEKWELSSPFQIGSGKAGFPKRPEAYLPVLITEMSAMGQFKIIPEVGIGGGLGWRQVFFQPASMALNLSGPLYQIKVQVFTSALVKRLQQKGLIPEKKWVNL